MGLLLKRVITTVTIISVIVFIASWFQLLPKPFVSYGIIYPIPVIVLGLVLSAGGLTKSYKKILKTTSLVVFVVLIILSAYYLFYGGEQSGVGVYFIWFIAVLALIAIYIILFIVSLIDYRKNK